MGIINAQELAVGDEERHVGASGDPDRDSMWFPNDGCCFSGRLEGALLDPMVRMQCTWTEWKDLHPNTLVLAPPNDPKQRDPRDGHGAEEYFGRPGIDQIFLDCIRGDIPLDRRLPESELVLGLSQLGGLRAYPLHDLKVEGGALNDRLGDLPVALLTGPESDTLKTGVFDRRLRDRKLDLVLENGRFRDRQTDSSWSIEGRAVEGPLAGEQLTPVHYVIARWHGWVYSHPATELWRTARRTAPARSILLGPFAPATARWERLGRAVEVERAIINFERPLESDFGLLVRVDGDRLRLHRFENAVAAADYAYAVRHAVRRGRVVLESDPDRQFTDVATQRERLPDEEIEWSALLADESVLGALDDVAPGEPEEPGFREIVEGLRGSRYPARLGIDVAMNVDIPQFPVLLTQVARQPAVDNGIHVTIDRDGGADNFVIYRFQSAGAAESYAGDPLNHAFAIGRHVFRSIPDDRFRFARYGAVDRPDERVSWSPLIGDAGFTSTLESILHPKLDARRDMAPVGENPSPQTEVQA